MKKTLECLLRGVVFSAAIACFSGQALAQQTPEAQTGTAFPGRVEQQLRRDGFVPRVAPRVEVRKLEIQGAPEGAEDIKFELAGIRIDGVTAYPLPALEQLYADKKGTLISLADLYAIAAEMTRKYRNDGYILTQVIVPPQTIEGGMTSLRVVEGTIDKIDVQGFDDPSMGLIRAYASRIQTGGGPLNSKDLERSLLLINDLPGVTSRAVLNPSPSVTGAADLLIIVERKPFDAQIGIDNHGTRFLGPVQLSAAGALNSFLGYNERITAQFVNAGIEERFHELLYGSLSYEQPVWENGTMAKFGFSHTHTDPGYTLKQFDVQGWSTNMHAQLTHPFIRSRALNLSGHARFDYTNISTKNNIPVDPTREDSLRVLRFGGKFENIDNFFGVGYNVLDMEVSKGLDILGASNEGEANLSRPAGDPTFTKMTAELQRLQRISSDINLLLGATGQWSSDALLSAEEFGVGGLSYGRGYDSSEVIGDEGIAGKAELQWNEPYELSPMQDYQLFSFYDAGRVWNDDATTSSAKKETLTSAGLGIRADFSDTTTAGFTLAFPLNNTPQTDNNKSPRAYVSLYRKF